MAKNFGLKNLKNWGTNMREKDDFISILREMENSFDASNIEDYYNIIGTIGMLMANKEEDSEIWEHILSIVGKVMSTSHVDSPKKNNDMGFTPSTNDVLYYRLNNFSDEKMKQQVQKYDELSDSLKKVISFRIVCPDICEPNYGVFLD
ncbi:hypothetical protein M2140_000130 [Clostridiales Family XIII bacterium PM5-7]